MPKIDPNASKHITEYIDALAPFAKEICTRLRAIILASSDQLVEDWKWGPNYNASGMICGFAGFKNHAKLTFFRGSEMKDSYGLFNHCLENIGNRSIKFISVNEIDEKKLIAYVKEAVKINQAQPAVKKISKEVVVPDVLKNLLKKNLVAKKNFEAMSPYRQKEFIEQVETAKRPETLASRLDKILPMLEANIGWNDKHRQNQKMK